MSQVLEHITLAQARAEYQRGLLSSATVEPHNDVEYRVKLISILPSETPRFLAGHRGSVRIFKSADTVLNTLKEIGFSNIVISAER